MSERLVFTYDVMCGNWNRICATFSPRFGGAEMKRINGLTAAALAMLIGVGMGHAEPGDKGLERFATAPSLRMRLLCSESASRTS